MKDFTGREWIVDEIFNWLELDQRQFFVLIEDPRSAKSSIVAWLAGNFSSNNGNHKNDGSSNDKFSK